jgi:hypothetical protein
MNADTVAVIVKTTSSGAKTTTLVFYPLEDADLRVNAVMWAGSATATGNVALKNTAKTTDITGFVDITTAQVTELITYGALKPIVAHPFCEHTGNVELTGQNIAAGQLRRRFGHND